MMNDRNLLRTGSLGTAIAAICCFTPALAVAAYAYYQRAAATQKADCYIGTIS